MSQPHAMNIGEVLRCAGKVTQDHIDDAVTLMSVHPGMKIGEALVMMRACTMEDVIVALDRQKRMAEAEGDTVDALDEVASDAAAFIRKVASTVAAVSLTIAMEAP